METECHNNILVLHVFIESWLNASIDKSRQAFQYFEDALDSDFVIIHPGGKIQSKPDIVNDFWLAHGVKPESFKIEIKNIQNRFLSESLCILNYEEHQTETPSRISTVVFMKTTNTSTFRWFHLHETWL